MYRDKIAPSLFIPLLLIILSACSIAMPSNDTEVNRQVSIIGSLSGNFPIVALTALPEVQRTNPVGYLVNQQQLDSVMQYFQADGKVLPDVDFSSQIVLFARNTVFYNRLSIAQVTLIGETLSVLSMETRSARPIDDKVAMSLVVIPREGARFIAVAGGNIKINND